MASRSRRRSGRPARFGPYVVVDRLGRGGMGTVYRARHDETREEHALKVARPGPGVARRFRREAEVLARVGAHPTIVGLRAAGVERGVPWYAMDLVEGGRPLARIVDGRPLPHRRAARIVAACARAIEHCHRRGVLHRDLGPTNILVDRRGRPRVVDFGIAFDRFASSLTPNGTLVGTPAFLAPEQLAGRDRSIGPPVDVYGLGAVLFAALTGRPPHEHREIGPLLYAIRFGPEPRPRSVSPRIPPELDAICRRALRRDPDGRHRSAAALARDLERWLAGRPSTTLVARPELPARIQTHVRRHVTGAAVVASAAMIGAIGLGGRAVVLTSRAEAARPAGATDTTGASDLHARAPTRGALDVLADDEALGRLVAHLRSNERAASDAVAARIAAMTEVAATRPDELSPTRQALLLEAAVMLEQPRTGAALARTSDAAEAAIAAARTGDSVARRRAVELVGALVRLGEVPLDGEALAAVVGPDGPPTELDDPIRSVPRAAAIVARGDPAKPPAEVQRTWAAVLDREASARDVPGWALAWTATAIGDAIRADALGDETDGPVVALARAASEDASLATGRPGPAGQAAVDRLLASASGRARSPAERADVARRRARWLVATGRGSEPVTVTTIVRGLDTLPRTTPLAFSDSWATLEDDLLASAHAACEAIVHQDVKDGRCCRTRRAADDLIGAARRLRPWARETLAMDVVHLFAHGRSHEALARARDAPDDRRSRRRRCDAHRAPAPAAAIGLTSR